MFRTDLSRWELLAGLFSLPQGAYTCSDRLRRSLKRE
jgi:hypothetical protein